MLAAWREEYEHHGLVLDEDAWLAELGGDQDRYSALAERVGLAYDVETSRARKRAREAELVAELALRDGVGECLRQAEAAALGLALVSSSPRTWVRPHLDRLALTDKFHVMVTREDAKRSKPHPNLYLAALAHLCIVAKDAIAIEDSANGVSAAQAAEIRCIAFPNTVTVRQDLTHAHAFAGRDLWAQVQALATQLVPIPVIGGSLGPVGNRAHRRKRPDPIPAAPPAGLWRRVRQFLTWFFAPRIAPSAWQRRPYLRDQNRRPGRQRRRR